METGIQTAVWREWKSDILVVIGSIIGKFKILIVKRTYDVFSMDFCNCSSATCICVSENGTTNFWENKKNL